MAEDLRATYKALLDDSRQISDLGRIMGLLGWDQETYMPAKGVEAKSRQLALLAGIVHRRNTAEKRGAWIARLTEHEDELSPDEKAVLRETRRAFERMTKLPAELVEEESRTCSLAHQDWIRARHESDFSVFADWLEKIVSIKKRIAGHWGYPNEPYDAMLDDYEPGATAESTGEVLAGLRAKLVPWVRKFADSGRAPRIDFLSQRFPVASQTRLAKFAMTAIGFDPEAGRLDISAHPFCSGTGGDVRLTTRYYEDQPFASLYGVIHEAGHGLYEQNLAREHEGTPLGESSSMSIHESQSRLWENVVGRSRAFLAFMEPTLRAEYKEQLAGVSLDDLYFAVNRVEPSLIRVEADEVTYGLHIILRFEIERDLLSGKLAVKDLPAAWNAKMQEFLGVTPQNDALGCLQDVHWSLGMFGYFPSYLLGSLNAAQLYAKARTDVPGIDEGFAEGRFAPLLAWLRENVHTHGRRYLPADLIEHVTGRPPSPDDFMAYVAEKYGALYGVSA
ncbi:carboxypeptidase M32 [bacterium]|nr:carboxypeptidase M32 [bacterium]